MSEPEKPFACTMNDCQMSFTNEDHLNVHIKKHDMMLQLGGPKGSSFIVDQTPTPSRFISSCDEVSLFQDLQNVNPFDEGFKRAMENKSSMHLCPETPVNPSDGSLHTPTFAPLSEPIDSRLIRQNVTTIQRSSSDETTNGQTMKCMFESNTISTKSHDITITETIEKQHIEIDTNADYTVNQDSLNIQHVEIRNSDVTARNVTLGKTIRNSKFYKKRNLALSKSTEEHSKQKDSISSAPKPSNNAHQIDNMNNFEIIVKLPNGQEVKMGPVDNKRQQNDTNGGINVKTKLRETMENKNKQVNVLLIPNFDQTGNAKVIPINSGHLIPVNPVIATQTEIARAKVPIPKMPIRREPRRKIEPTIPSIPSKVDIVKPIIHKLDCSILTVLGASCSKNCANDSSIINQSIASNGIPETNDNLDSDLIMLDPPTKQSNEASVIQCSNVKEKSADKCKRRKNGFGSANFKKAAFAEANRRYRQRQKDMQQMTLKQNETLTKENKELKHELAIAKKEISKLKGMLIDHMRQNAT